MSRRGSNILTLVRVDLRALWSSPRYLMLIPLAMAGLAVALWPYVGSPFAPLLAALMFGVEPAFANVLFRSDRDFESIALLPVAWEDVVLARNIATAASGTGAYILMVLSLIYVLPETPAMEEILGSFLWWGVMLFPLLHIGNELSVVSPRRRSGWTFEDVAEAGVFLAIGAVVALVHPFLSLVSGGPYASLLFVLVAGAYWWRRSIPGSAERIRMALPTLALAQ